VEKPIQHIETEIALVGGGPSALMAATFLLDAGLKVRLYEYTSSLAKKFNVAGKSGLNLTNSLEDPSFIEMYGDDAAWIRPFILNFNNKDLRETLLHFLGIETYIGSSGKVFPKEDLSGARFIKLWIKYLKGQGLAVFTHHKFIGWIDDNALQFEDRSGDLITVYAKKAMLAMGGVSWPMTGSDGNWIDSFKAKGIQLAPWQASNCGVQISADATFFEKWNGQFLKNVQLSLNGKSVKGEIRISRYGFEGKPIYHLVPEIRKELRKGDDCTLSLDFKANMSAENLLKKLEELKGNSLSKTLKSLSVHPSFSMLLKIYQLDYTTSVDLVKWIKSFPIRVEELADIKKAISVVGGVSKEELNEDLSLKKVPNSYLAGEMIDWDAPTGGYLLQACFSMAKTVADSMIEDLKF